MNRKKRLSANGAAQRAVIYCRVSSAKQVEEGHGLESQETRCREYAAARGYDVVETFHDRAVSGSLVERPGVVTLLGFLKKESKSGGEHVVIIDDISRLARDIRVHSDLRLAIHLAGGRLESPSIEFGEDSDSQLIENLLASVSQHQRQKNGEQTKNRMRARAMNGYWVFHAPVGYRYEKVSGHGKLLVRDEPCASIIEEALEGYASGRFESQSEVKAFLDGQPEFPKDRRTGEVRYEEVARLFKRPHYAGYIEVPEWGVAMRKGHHEGLVSFETWQSVQRRMEEGARAPNRKDLNADFPLRGFIACGDCGKPLTACWSTSKTGKKHPYYHCFTKACPSHRKSIKRDQLEGEFESALKAVQPSANIYALAKAMFRDAWSQRAAQAKEIAKGWKERIALIERQSAQLLDRLMEATSPQVIAAYEKRLEELEREKLLVREKLESAGKPQRDFDEMFELAMAFLSSPWKLWENGKIELRRAVLRMVFLGRVEYCRKEGLRTPDIALPFKALGGKCGNQWNMAEREGFEPSKGLHP